MNGIPKMLLELFVVVWSVGVVCCVLRCGVLAHCVAVWCVGVVCCGVVCWCWYYVLRCGVMCLAVGLLNSP